MPPASGPSSLFSSSSRKDILLKFKSGIIVKDRRYRLRIYKSCFIGRELIDFLIQDEQYFDIKTREEAVIVGQKFQKDYKLFKHVCDDHELEDDYLFYRFIDNDDDDDSSTSRNNEEGDDSTNKSCGDNTTTEETASSTSTSSEQQNDNDNDNDPHLRPSMMDCQHKIGLISIGNILKYDIPLTYKFSIDREFFKATDAINFMVMNGLASDRNDAIKIGLALQREEIIESIGYNSENNGPHRFRDGPRLYFGFVNSNNSSSHDDDNNNINDNDKWEDELATICKLFATKIQTGNEVYRLKTYPDCFIGSVAITTIVNTLGITSSRRDAVLLGRSIAHEYQLFQHVTYDHIFDDLELFYRFTKQSTDFETIMENFRNRKK